MSDTTPFGARPIGGSTPGGLPPMTLEQAVELINRIRTIQHGLPEFLGRNATIDSLSGHAQHAYKAAILLFDHCWEIEHTLQALQEQIGPIAEAGSVFGALLDDPTFGPPVRLLLDQFLAQSGETAGISHPG